MATASRFNRPYGPSAPGQSAWEKINRPDRKLGDQSLANQAATPSGRGYYDPARILERVARGRPGTTMQQAQAVIAAEGYKEFDKLRNQMGQQGSAGAQPGANIVAPLNPQTAGAATRFAGAFKDQEYVDPRREGLGGYLDAMTQGWNALQNAATPSPRSQKILEAKGSGTFDAIREKYNAANKKSHGSEMDMWGVVYNLGADPEKDVTGIKYL